MSGPNKPWWDGPGLHHDFTLKVERTGRPPLPWTWQIVTEGALVHGGVRGGTPPASAGSGGANGNRLGDPDHAVEHLDRDGGFALLRG